MEKKERTNNEMVRIERESEVIAAIDSYINRGCSVQVPLYIELCSGWGRSEIQNDLSKSKRYSWLGVEGHPFLRGHKHFINENGEMELIAEHPELTSNFYPPSGYDPKRPPSFFMVNKISDKPNNLSYYLDCVSNLQIPLVYFTNGYWRWSDRDTNRTAPQAINAFERIKYEPTVSGWLADIKDEDETPMHIRLKEHGITRYDHLIYELLDEALNCKDADEILPKILGLHYQKREEMLIAYAESIENLENYNDLLDYDPFTGEKKSGGSAAIHYLLELLMSFFNTMFCKRVFNLKVDPRELNGWRQNIWSLSDSFIDFIKDKEYGWVFDDSKTIPDSILKDVKQITG